jgi:hypothetical protein
MGIIQMNLSCWGAVMGLSETLYLISGVVVGMAGLALIRWFLLRPVRRNPAERLIEELNCFSAQIGQLSARMADLSRNIENRNEHALHARHVEIVENLAAMNRLIRELNQFFADAEARTREESDVPSDFTDRSEESRFQKLGSISADEIARTNWDELLERLRREEKK